MQEVWSHLPEKPSIQTSGLLSVWRVLWRFSLFDTLKPIDWAQWAFKARLLPQEFYINVLSVKISYNRRGP
jgi:hypothetical protein